MSEDQICRTLSTKGQWIDYRPSSHHSLFKADSTFDVRFAAVLQCNTIVDRTLQAVFESYHKSLFVKLCQDIKNKEHSVIDISFVSTAFSDGDRDYFINQLIPKLQQETACHVVDPVCDGCQSAHDLLVNIADCLNCKLIDRAALLRSKGNTPTYIQSAECIRDTPLRAIASILSQRNANNTVRSRTQEQDSPSRLVIVFRHCEMISTHILNGLLVLLNGPKVGFEVSMVAFTDVLCTLPVQFSAAAQAVIRASLHTTVPPFELYDAQCVSLFNGQEIPVMLSSWLIEHIHTAFSESELCLTSAVNRFKVSIASHFEGRLSILSMYRETAWLQKMNILSRSESQFAPSAEKLKRAHSTNSINNSSTYSHNNSTVRNSIGNNTEGESKRSSVRSAGKGKKEKNASANDSIAEADDHTIHTLNTTENTIEHTIEHTIEYTPENSVDDAADDSTIATLNTIGNNTLTTFNSTLYTTSTPFPFSTINTHNYNDITLSHKAKQTSVIRLKHQHGLVALLNLLKSNDLVSTGLLYKPASSYIHSNVTDEQRVILEVFEVYDVRRKVDTAWFTLMKMLRDQLLPRQDDSRRYCADLLWGDTLSLDTSASTTTATAATSLNTSLLSTSLLYAVQQSLPTISCAFVQAAVSNIREMADTHRKEILSLMEVINRAASRNNTTTNSNNTESTTDSSDINIANSVDYTAYNAFLQALEDGAKDIEITFEGVAEYLETTNIGLHLSLKKMKEKLQSDQLNTTMATTPTISNNSDNNIIPDLTYSKESHSVTCNSINFYEEACVDLTNWLITIALQYAALPSAAQLVSQRLSLLPLYRASTHKTSNSSSKSMKESVVRNVNMDGVLYLHPLAEDRALKAIDSNVHARFASALKAPSDHLPTPSTTNNTTATTATAASSDHTTSFAPDTSVLYSMIKSCRQKEVASVWFDKFTTLVSAYSGSSSSTSAAYKEHAKRGSKRRFKTLDEKTVLKCRFANALYDIESSGIVKCSRTSVENPTVTIERKIYTWV